MKSILFLILLFTGNTVSAQEIINIDFGSSAQDFQSLGNWNNITPSFNSNSKMKAELIDSTGMKTGVSLNIDDPFDTYNTAGELGTINSFEFPITATLDNFFGENLSFNGQSESSGGFKLEGMDPSKSYTFIIFSSRKNSLNNRETLYMIKGSNLKRGVLDAANNSSNFIEVKDVRPNYLGNVSFRAAAGPNNTDETGYYYLGAIKIKSEESSNSNVSSVIKSLKIYPNPIEDQCEISLDLENKSHIKIDLYSLLGTLEQTLVETDVDSNHFDYVWKRNLSENLDSKQGIYLIDVQVNGKSFKTKVLLR